MTLALCVTTFRRPAGLRRLLDGLSRQVFTEHPPDVRIVVVDNDGEGSARHVCERLRPNLRWPLSYIIEPRRGIAFGRNAAVAEGGSADWIAFIDDDEVPEPNWLSGLIEVQNRYGADVVCGPVIADYLEPPPPWVVAGGFFDQRRYQTGERLRYAFTNNVLFRTGILKCFPRPFDPRCALIGCEDRHFFQRVALAGFKIVWADDARVVEYNPLSRTTLSWVTQRMYRVGVATSFIEMDIDHHRRFGRFLVLAGKGIGAVPLGCVEIATGLLFGRHRCVKGLRYIAYGCGLLLGLFGFRYEEYRKTHGS